MDVAHGRVGSEEPCGLLLMASCSVIGQATAPELCGFPAGTSQTWNVLEDPSHRDDCLRVAVPVSYLHPGVVIPTS